MPKGDEFCKLANWVLEVERLPQRATKLKPALSAGFFCFICETLYLWAMKKGSKRIDNNYTVEISNLAFKSSFTASSNSLRELIEMIKTYVPSMDTYSKVYREMRINLGTYISLFTLPLPNKKVRKVVVHITSANITEEDIERFHAHAATLPQGPPVDFPE
jgi:hypothetical protein